MAQGGGRAIAQIQKAFGRSAFQVRKLKITPRTRQDKQLRCIAASHRTRCLNYRHARPQGPAYFGDCIHNYECIYPMQRQIGDAP